MASTTTQNKKIEKPANGDYVGTWDVPVNADWDDIDAAFGNVTALNVVGLSGVQALTVTQYRPPFMVMTGLLTANVNYQLPSTVGGFFWIFNNTTGAFSVTFSSAGGGTSVVIPQGSRVQAICDGTNVVFGSAGAGANADITSLLALGLTGLLKGTGASPNPVTTATAGTDYVAPATATNFTAPQTFTGSSSLLAEILVNAAEITIVSATAATGTIAYYPSTQSVLYYTSNAAANWTINITFSVGTTLNTALATGQSITVTHLVTQGGAPFFNNVVQVDGTTSGVTTKWQGGAPIAGNASGVDVYTYCVIKTGSAAFTVFASQTQFK